MMRTLLALGAVSLAAAAALRATEDRRAASRFDRQAIAHELALARTPSRFVHGTGTSRELRTAVRAERARCPECTVLGAGPDSVELELAPALRARWSRADVDRVRGAWTLAFVELGDAGGAGRALVRSYMRRLARDGLVEASPEGALAPLPPPDPERVRSRVHGSSSWGGLLALAVAAFGLAALQNARARVKHPGAPNTISKAVK